MRILIPDDYQDAVRHLVCFETLAGHQVTVYHDHTEDDETLATCFQEADALGNARLSPSHSRSGSQHLYLTAQKSLMPIGQLARWILTKTMPLPYRDRG